MQYTLLIPIFTNVKLDQLKETKNKKIKTHCLIRPSESSTLQPIPTQYYLYTYLHRKHIRINRPSLNLKTIKYFHMLNINCHCYGMLDHITNEVNSLLSQIINAEKEASRFKGI